MKNTSECSLVLKFPPRGPELKIPVLKLGQAVTVDWVDTKSALGWSYDPNAKRTLARVRSLGYVVQVNNEVLTLTTSLSDGGKSLDDLSLPIGCVTRIVEMSNDWSVNGPEENPDAQTV